MIEVLNLTTRYGVLGQDSAGTSTTMRMLVRPIAHPSGIACAGGPGA